MYNIGHYSVLDTELYCAKHWFVFCFYILLFGHWHMVSNFQTRSKMSAMVCNCSRAVWKYIWHLDRCDIIDNSDSSDSKEEKTCWQNLATVCVSKRHNLGFIGPWVCAVSAPVLGVWVEVMVDGGRCGVGGIRVCQDPGYWNHELLQPWLQQSHAINCI